MFWDIYLKKAQYGKRFLISLFSEALPTSITSFLSLPFDRAAISPANQVGVIEHIDYSAPSHVKQEICDFLRNEFCRRHRQSHPILHFTVDTLFESKEKDHIFIVKQKIDEKDKIIGTVRYHWIGYFMSGEPNPPEIYLVDALCVHRDWRGQHIVDQLLTELHRFANQNHMPHAVYLTEGGSSHPFFPFGFVMSDYAYRNTSNHIVISPQSRIKTLTPSQAFSWLKVYLQLHPTTFFIGHENCSNIQWVFYQHGSTRILAGIQDTHQRYPDTYEKMGWITVWLPYGDNTDEDLQRASLEISEYVSQEYPWMWTSSKWAGLENEKEWKRNHPYWRPDGYFKWHRYQWHTFNREMYSNGFGLLI